MVPLSAFAVLFGNEVPVDPARVAFVFETGRVKGYVLGVVFGLD